MCAETSGNVLVSHGTIRDVGLCFRAKSCVDKQQSFRLRAAMEGVLIRRASFGLDGV